jgi:hypothetical protein
LAVTQLIEERCDDVMGLWREWPSHYVERPTVRRCWLLQRLLQGKGVKGQLPYQPSRSWAARMSLGAVTISFALIPPLSAEPNNRKHIYIGVEPSHTAIASGEYLGARKLYAYLNKDRIGLVPHLEKIATEFVSARALGADGYLLKLGSVAANRGGFREHAGDRR